MSISHVDLEQGCMITVPYQNSESDEDLRSICFSDDDVDSCYSAFYSTAGGSSADGVSESRRDSSVSVCSVYVEIQGEEDGSVKIHLDDDDDDLDDVGDELRECRICHLSLGNGIGVIELGCDCKNDLALAHSNCAERWFMIRGNRVCEICNSTAENVNVVCQFELMQHSTVPFVPSIITAPLAPAAPAERPHTTENFCRGHLIMNFLLACMVFAFVIYWLFHFKVPS